MENNKHIEKYVHLQAGHMARGLRKPTNPKRMKKQRRATKHYRDWSSEDPLNFHGVPLGDKKVVSAWSTKLTIWACTFIFS